MTQHDPPTVRFEQVREIDHVVLACIRQGKDLQQINADTVYENREVNYCFTKLEDLGLIDTHTPDGTVERVVDGETRVFQAPKQAHLTNTGAQYFAWTDRQDTIDAYRNMDHSTLARRVYELEERLDELETTFEAFQKQVREKLTEK
jgi:regulator of replication initiation timing